MLSDFFANSGTEAIEASIKAVRGYQAAVGKPERHRIIGMSDSFHGRTIAAVAASGNPSYVQNFAPTDHGFDHIAWGDMAALDVAITDNTAGVIVETVQGEGGIRRRPLQWEREKWGKKVMPSTFSQLLVKDWLPAEKIEKDVS